MKKLAYSIDYAFSNLKRQTLTARIAYLIIYDESLMVELPTIISARVETVILFGYSNER